MIARQPRKVDARSELSLADRHIAEMEGRLGRQMQIISALAVKSQDTAATEELLRVIEQSLALMYAHREMILQELAAEEGELASCY